MTAAKREIEAAIEVFVHGYSTGRSRTFPYEASRVGPLWLMRDAPRKNARDYRNEEWVVHDVAAEEADAIVRQHARPGFAISALIANDEPDGPTRTAYKALGYRLLRTEGFFVQRLRQIPSRRRLSRSSACVRSKGRRNWEKSYADARSRPNCYATARHFANMWRSMATLSLDVCAASARR